MVPFGFILLVVVVPFCCSVDFSFIREPDSEIIEDGHAIFMCEPSQSFATVQWFRDDQELLPNSSNVVKMSTCGRVHSLEVLESKRAKYHCVIGMKKSSLKLLSRKGEAIPITIDEFSTLNTTDRQIEVSQGATAVIPCGPLPRSEPPAIPNVHFLKKRKRIVLKLGHRFQVMPSGNVFVRNAQPKDSGEYQCLAENPLTDERREAPFKVHLNVRSQDSEQPVNKNASLVHGPPLRTEAVIGSNVTMECLGDGFPKPQIQWKRPNSYLPEGHIEGENTLTLLSVTPKHAGIYECSVSNSVTVRSRTTLVVLEPPRLKEPQTKTHTVEVGKSLNLECEVLRGEPKPNISWIFNAEPLRSHSGRSIFVSEREVFIRKISKHLHEGGYQCFATNSLGSTYVQYLVQVVSAVGQDDGGLGAQDSGSDGSRKGFPSSTRTDDRMKLPSPSKPDIQQISSSAVLITWLIDPTELSVLFFKVQYMVKGGEWKTLDVDVNPWQTAYQLDGLQPLQHRFRLIAVYENDDHRSSKPSRWITLVDMPEVKQNEAPKLTPMVTVSSDAPTSLTVQWKLENPTSGAPEVVIDGFILKYRRIDSAGEWTTHRQPKDAPRSFTIEHLKAGQHYEVKMAAFNQYGVGNFSTARVARTKDATTRPPPPVNQVPLDDNADRSQNENNNMGKEMPQRTAFQKHHLIAIAVIGATLGILSLVCLVCAIQYGRNSSARTTEVDKRLRREAAAYVNDANLNFTPSISTVDLASNSPNSKRFDDDDLMTDSEDSGSESMKSVSHEEVPRSEKEYALRILTQLYATNGHIVNFDTQSSRVHSV